MGFETHQFVIYLLDHLQVHIHGLLHLQPLCCNHLCLTFASSSASLVQSFVPYICFIFRLPAAIICVIHLNHLLQFSCNYQCLLFASTTASLLHSSLPNVCPIICIPAAIIYVVLRCVTSTTSWLQSCVFCIICCSFILINITITTSI